MLVDFHVHTTVSDGRFSPEGVLELAIRAGLRLLSITDHDAIDGFDRAAARLLERRATGGPGGGEPTSPLRLLAGVEFSTSLGQEEVHILGYFPAGVPDCVRAFLREAERSRTGRIEEAVSTLTRLGYPISFDEVKRHSPGRTIGRAHLARAMVERGIAVTFADAFRRFLGNERGVVPPSRNRAEDVVALIRAEGGLAALAHPDLRSVDEVVRALLPAGLEGLEIYGRRRRGVDQLYLETLARELGLWATAGSDWHGHGKVPNLAGVSIGKDRIGAFLARLGVAEVSES
jgi:predicted metal-dependent phosphoesterase TrpH